VGFDQGACDEDNVRARSPPLHPDALAGDHGEETRWPHQAEDERNAAYPEAHALFDAVIKAGDIDWVVIR
jgi:hypothetical protein